MKVRADLVGSVHLDGFPQAIKMVEVVGEKAKLLADLTLHQSDLLMPINCLAILEALPMLDERQQTVKFSGTASGSARGTGASR
jgi:hypothetical protein